jgi:drug/metabolite transporter (DMT)-like permease
VWAVRHRVAPLHLALGKSAFLAAVSAAALGLAMAAEGEPAAALWPGWRQPEGWAIILWSAAGPGALAALLHVKGQSLVSPTNAQIVFCSVPLWSALLAAVVLPGEAVGAATWGGGAAIGAAGLVAALPPRGSRQG